MTSSDSEDDCYANAAKRLCSIKNKYQGDNLESANILNDSKELDEIVKNSNIDVNKLKLNDPIFIPKTLIEFPSSSIDVSQDIVETTTSGSRRVTRASKRKHTKSDAQTSILETIICEPSVVNNTDMGRGRGRVQTRGREKVKGKTRVRARTRGRGKIRESLSNCSTLRASSRGRRPRDDGRMPSALLNCLSAVMPTYSIGNTDEYPDESDSQALFSNKTTSDDVILVDNNEILEENEEMSVKVYWQSSEIFKFTIRKFQKLVQVFDYFSQKENVSYNKLLFTYNDRILKPGDTPESINYNFVKFIDGGIVENVLGPTTVSESNIKNGIKIKFQCQNAKPFEIVTCLDDKFLVAMMKCAEALEKPLKKLKFEFDGDSISGLNTAREMELEGGECVDVNILI